MLQTKWILGKLLKCRKKENRNSEYFHQWINNAAMHSLIRRWQRCLFLALIQGMLLFHQFTQTVCGVFSSLFFKKKICIFVWHCCRSFPGGVQRKAPLLWRVPSHYYCCCVPCGQWLYRRLPHLSCAAEVKPVRVGAPLSVNNPECTLPLRHLSLIQLWIHADIILSLSSYPEMQSPV